MFNINGVWWDLVFVPPGHHTLFRSDGSQTVAVCDNFDRAIYLDNTLYGSFLKKVLCHEITHAAMFSYGVELDLYQEEIIADLFATYGNEIITLTNQIFFKYK